MNKPLLLALTALATAAVSAPAHADTWTPKTELVPSNAAAIRVVEPEGYTFTIEGRTDTAPAVFNLANRDQYVVVDAYAPDGAHWQQKIEVRAYTQTVLRLHHQKDAPPPPAPAQAAPTYVGVLYNTTHLCPKLSDRFAVRFDITSAAGTVTHVLEPRSRVDVTLAGGTYTLRQFTARNGAWEFASSQTLTVKKDGWMAGMECK